MPKKYILLVAIGVIAAFLLGIGFVRIWDRVQKQSDESYVPSESASILTVDLENSVPLDEVKEEPSYLDASKLPSNLAENPFDGIAEVRSPEEQNEEPTAQEQIAQPRPVAPVVLKTDKPVVKPQDILPTVSAQEEGTNITLIQIPVVYKLIKTQDEYKVFKRKARGKYPEVNFAKQMLVVLESDNDMPDKVFEIVKVIAEKEQVTVEYRVNIFGLDKKTNTHTVAVTDRTDKPVVLKQIL